MTNHSELPQSQIEEARKVLETGLEIIKNEKYRKTTASIQWHEEKIKALSFALRILGRMEERFMIRKLCNVCPENYAPVDKEHPMGSCNSEIRPIKCPLVKKQAQAILTAMVKEDK